MVRTVLEDIAKNGLPGEHHFYITFDTGSDGVRLSQRMRAQYPEEMTVVLQHQFWDLSVSEEAFEVGMSFGGIPERLEIPFAAIKAFVDPSVQFALQFQEIDPDAAQADAPESAGAAGKETTRKPARVPSEQKKKRTAPSIAAVPTAANSAPEPGAAAASDDDPDKPRGGGGEVVRLDRFRKK
jgi:hypothetical protein